MDTEPDTYSSIPQSYDATIPYSRTGTADMQVQVTWPGYLMKLRASYKVPENPTRYPWPQRSYRGIHQSSWKELPYLRFGCCCRGQGKHRASVLTFAVKIHSETSDQGDPTFLYLIMRPSRTTYMVVTMRSWFSKLFVTLFVWGALRETQDSSHQIIAVICTADGNVSDCF